MEHRLQHETHKQKCLEIHVPSLEPFALIKFEPAKSIQTHYKIVLNNFGVIHFFRQSFLSKILTIHEKQGKEGHHLYSFLPFPSAQFRHSFKTEHVR